MSGSLIDTFLPHLDSVEHCNGYVRARCPAHLDRHPSLDLKEVGENGHRRLLLVCRAGCETQNILDKLGLSWGDLFSSNGSSKGSDDWQVTARYDYCDPAGMLLFQVERLQRSDEKKFRQRRPDGKGGWIYKLDGVEPVLYCLPEVRQAVAEGKLIFILEGEKDVANAREQLKVVATTIPGGASKWRDSYATDLRGADVILVGDNDEAGRRHIQLVGGKLTGVAKRVRVLYLPGLPEKGDLTDWLALGGTREQFDQLISGASPFILSTPESEFGEKAFLPVRSLREIVSSAEETPDWIVKGLLKEGELTDFAGLAKFSGKTTFAMHALKAMRTGDLFLGEPVKEARVLYLSEQGNNFGQAIEDAGLGLDDDGFAVVQHRDVRGEEWANLVEKAVKVCERNRYHVLVVDTFAAFAGLVGSEENNSGDIRERMEPLKKAAQSHGLAVMVIRHAGKDGKGRGSSQFEAEADIVATLKRPEGNHAETVRQLETIGRYGATRQNIELTERGYVPLGSDDKVAFSKAVTFIKGVLPRRKESAITETALEEKAKGEISKGSLLRALRWLVEQETVLREGKGKRSSPYTYWHPPHKSEATNTFSPNPAPGVGSLGRKQSGARELINDATRVSELATSLSETERVALDLETTGLDPLADKVRLLSLCVEENAYLIDCFAVDPTPVLEALKVKGVVAHNASFDLSFLFHSYGYEHAGEVLDTMIASQVLHMGAIVPGTDRKKDGERKKGEKIPQSLKAVLNRELSVTLDKEHQGGNWGGDITNPMLDYAANDVLFLAPLAETLEGRIKEAGLTWALDVESQALLAHAWLACSGVPLDRERWLRKARENAALAEQKRARLDELVPDKPGGGAWNWNSWQQVQEAASLVGVQLPDTKEATIKRYADEHPLMPALLEYRRASKLANTYGEDWLRGGKKRERE